MDAVRFHICFGCLQLRELGFGIHEDDLLMVGTVDFQLRRGIQSITVYTSGRGDIATTDGDELGKCQVEVELLLDCCDAHLFEFGCKFIFCDGLTLESTPALPIVTYTAEGGSRG